MGFTNSTGQQCYRLLTCPKIVSFEAWRHPIFSDVIVSFLHLQDLYHDDKEKNHSYIEVKTARDQVGFVSRVQGGFVVL